MRRREAAAKTAEGDVCADKELAGNLVVGSPEPRQPLPAALAAWTGNLLYWVANAGGTFYATVLEPLGLRPAQVAVLQVLAGEGAMVQARLSERTLIDRTTMVSLLNDLEQQQLIARRPALTDKRAFTIHLLDAGQQRLAEVEQLSRVADRQFFGVLSPEEQGQLHELLRRLATAAETK